MSGLSRARTLMLLSTAAVVALGVFVATSGGSQVSSYTYQPATFTVAPSARAASTSYASYVSTVVSLGGHKYTYGTINCPKKGTTKAISGQFATGSAAIFVTDSYRVGSTGWYTEVTNTGSAAAHVQIGTICSS